MALLGRNHKRVPALVRLFLQERADIHELAHAIEIARKGRKVKRRDARNQSVVDV